jgi:acetylglutamate kinase
MSLVVIKLGGEVVADTHHLKLLVTELVALKARGCKVVVIHGGGPQATALTSALGLNPEVVGGRRITSPQVLEVMKMTLGGSVSVDLAAACRAQKLPSLGLSGVSAGLIQAVRRPPRIVSGCGDEPVDFGEVGDVRQVNTQAIHGLLELGYVPIISSLSADDNGRVFNINADIVACHVAVALKVSALVLVTSADGVMRNLDDDRSRFARLSVSQAKALIADGTVYGGMIPKLEESFRVVESGVNRVIILKTTTLGSIEAAISGSTDYGTTLYADV